MTSTRYPRMVGGVLAVIAVAACTGTDDAVPAEVSTSSTSTTSTTSSTSSPTLVPVTEAVAPAETGEPIELVTLATIGAQRAAALADLDGFTATQTNNRFSESQTRFEATQDITALADGRVWTENLAGSWSTTDPTSGTFSAAFAGGFGGANYQSIRSRTGFAGDELTLAMGTGIDPTAPLEVYEPSRATITETSRDGRSTWTISASEAALDVDTEFDQTWVVDVETGLIVNFSSEKRVAGPGGHIDGFRSTLTDLRRGGELPADFPRPIPADADVEDQPGFDVSGGFRRVSLEQAAAEFGAGLVAPGDLPADATVLLYDHGIDNSGSNHPPQYEEVRIITRRGFDTTIITVTKFIPVDGLTMTDGDVQCYDVNRDNQCDHTGTQDPVRAGALADRHVVFGVPGGDPGAAILDVGRVVRITDVSPERARALAETFVVVEEESSGEL